MDTAITTSETIETANLISDLLASSLDAPVAWVPVVIEGGALDAKPTVAVKSFKSDRAARIAFGKAERAWEAARDSRIAIEHAQRAPETKARPTSEERARLDALRAEYAGLSGDDLGNSPAFNAYCVLWNEIGDRPRKAALLIEDTARAQMVAIYEQAKAQGIWIKSYHLNYNPTRDLIANNCD